MSQLSPGDGSRSGQGGDSREDCGGQEAGVKLISHLSVIITQLRSDILTTIVSSLQCIPSQNSIIKLSMSDNDNDNDHPNQSWLSLSYFL